MPTYYARKEGTGNGIQTEFTIDFPYLATSDIKALVDGSVTTAFTVVSNTVTFDDPIGDGLDYAIYRRTALDVVEEFELRGTPSSGGFNQVLVACQYIAQELFDIGASTLEAGVSALLAEKWATYTDGTVDGSDYSAKHYALEAQDSADDAALSADAAAASAGTVNLPSISGGAYKRLQVKSDETGYDLVYGTGGVQLVTSGTLTVTEAMLGQIIELQGAYTAALGTKPTGWFCYLNNVSSSDATVTVTTDINGGGASMTLYGKWSVLAVSEGSGNWSIGTVPVATTSILGALRVASQAEAEAGSSNSRMMTPLTVAQSIAANSAIKSTFVSSGQTITTSGLVTIAHGKSSAPFMVDLYLQCGTTDAGWAVNDVIKVTGDGNAGKALGVYYDATNIYVRYNSDAACFTSVNKSTGANTTLTNGSWTLIAKATFK